ncbi:MULTISPECIES: hypothetical protein [Pseudomonas]|uniref:hypothetical protein n=1 Tax=Pseudomonas TaxID=286 RepID=UPI0018ABF7B6|nr:MULTISPECIES: hypothetical protein [Pseudomonas]MBF8774452.1 hypothetical protein [Pseudomonas fulva]MBR7520351.1 hypothetical protein [Pseudomonas juntendi]
MKSNLISDWISVSQEAINKPQSETKNGIKIHFMISPFDIPVATRAGLDATKGEPGIYLIEFRYISSDEKTTITHPETKGISFEVGKNSRKIYKISIDLADIKTDIPDAEIQVALNFEIQSSLKELEAARFSSVNHGNADAIRRLFSPQGGAHIPLSPVFHPST